MAHRVADAAEQRTGGPGRRKKTCTRVIPLPQKAQRRRRYQERSPHPSQAFLEQLFGVLRDNFATLKHEIATEVKNLRIDIGDLGQRVDSLEQNNESCEDELEAHCKELLELRTQT
ncbi:hypothetical protein NDU88_000182 [Pleurodeles waltl]|uniref:Uncharacterized protein n=1 Tax=Pleurodeles waltl TaxID=8319 RepID=A0AAV7SWA7_PLEWA|nr:hypothetical protein NDU88_000182 [Pleurodeles waltl]